MVISTAVHARTHRQCPRRLDSVPRQNATGMSSTAPIAVRENTTVVGLRSRTATRIRRYGRPQITHIDPKRTQPRRVTL